MDYNDRVKFVKLGYLDDSELDKLTLEQLVEFSLLLQKFLKAIEKRIERAKRKLLVGVK